MRAVYDQKLFDAYEGTTERYSRIHAGSHPVHADEAMLDWHYLLGGIVFFGLMLLAISSFGV